MAAAKFSEVRALIFDLDGTLIDSKLDLIHSVNAMLREMRRPELATETMSDEGMTRERPLPVREWHMGGRARRPS